MAKRLNKQLVLGLTIASMIVTTAAMVVVIWKLPQKDPKIAAKEAEQLVQAAKYEEAMKKYQAAAKRAKAIPDLKQYADYMVKAGEMALKAGSAVDARMYWKDVTLNLPNNAAAQEHILKLLLEFANYGGSDWTAMQAEAQKLVDIEPNNPVGLHALGLALTRQQATDPKNAEAGEKHLIAAIQADKGNPDYVDKLVMFYLSVGRFDDAEKQCNQLVADAQNRRDEKPAATATAPEGPGPITRDAADKGGDALAKAYLLRSRFYAYKTEKLRADAAKAPAAETGTLMARAADAEKSAQADLEEAFKTAPGNSEVLVGLARFWLAKQPTDQAEQDRKKQTEANRAKAKQYYMEAIKVAPESFEAYQGLARVYAMEEQLDKALEVLKLRFDRGYNRKHYLAAVDTFRMLVLREDAFKINMSKLYNLEQQQTLPAEEKNKKRQAIIDRMTELYNQTVADTAQAEQHPWALFMKGRLLMIDGNANGAVAKFEAAEKAFSPMVPPELRQSLANLYLQTRAFGPAVSQLEALVRENPDNTTAWIMLAQVRLQLSFGADPTTKGATLAAADTAVKEVLRREPKNQQALGILARVYREQGNSAGAREIESQMGASPDQLKLRDAILMAMQSGGDEARLAEADKTLKAILVSDPLNMDAIRTRGLILKGRYAKAEEPAKAGIADEIRKIIDEARVAVARKIAESTSATQPATQPTAEQERYSAIAKDIERFAVVLDPRTSDEDKIRNFESLIQKEEDPYQAASQLFRVYCRTEKTTSQATEQAGKILAMDVKPEQGLILEEILSFAVKKKDWAMAEKCTAKLEVMIRTEKDPYLIAANLFRVYAQNENSAAQAVEQANAILGMDLAPNQGGIVEQVFAFALGKKDWPLAEKCIIPAAKTGLDPADGRLYRGRLRLAQAGAGESTEEKENARRARDELQLAVSAFPRQPMAHTWLGFAQMALKQFDEAGRAFEEARRLDPQNVPATIGMGMVAEARGDLKTLNSVLDACAQLAREHPWVKAQLAAREEQLNPDQAIARREEYRKTNPKDVKNLMALARLYVQIAMQSQAPNVKTAKQDEALKIYEECHNLQPANLEAVERYTNLLTIRRDYAAAEKAIEESGQAIDQKDVQQKANLQLLKAALLVNRIRRQSGEVPLDQRPKVDEAFIEAAKICNKPDILANVAKYFQQTGRVNETITWQRNLIAAIKEASPQPEAQKEFIIALIDMLLRTGDVQRSPEIEKEIGDFRGLFPQDSRAFFLEGRMQAMKGDDAKAIEAFGNYIKAAPQDPTGYAYRGQVYLLTRKLNEAIKDLQEVKRLDPTFRNHVPRVMLAQALRDTGLIDAAMSELQSVIDENPRSSQGIDDLLSIYESPETNRPGATDNLLAARAQADPQSPVWPGVQAEVAIQRKQFSDAVRYAQQAAEKSKNPDNENKLELARVDLLFRLYLQLGRFDELLAFVKDKLPPSQQNLPAAHLFMASAYAGKRDTEKTVEHYLAALQGEQADMGAASSMMVDDLKNGRLTTDAALAAIKKRLDAKPDDHLARLLAIVVQREQGEGEALMRSCRELADAIKPDSPKNKAILLWLKSQMAATAHLKNRQYDEARKLYEQMLELSKEGDQFKNSHVIALNNLAYMLMTNANDPQAALPYAKRAVEIAPNEGSVVDTLGWCQLLLKNYDEAVARLRQASELEQKLAPVRYHAAEAYYQRASAEGAKNREADLQTAKSEVQIAYDLISKSGKDEENIIGKVTELGTKLGLSLSKAVSGTAPAPKQ